MGTRIIFAAVAAFLLIPFSVGSTFALARVAPTPKAMTRHLKGKALTEVAQATPRGAVSEAEKEAHHLEQELTRHIAQKLAAGADATAAQKHKAEGDAALRRGDSDTAVQHYQAAERALPK